MKNEFKDYLWSINLRFFDEIRKETKEVGDGADIVSNYFSKTITQNLIPPIITITAQKVI